MTIGIGYRVTAILFYIIKKYRMILRLFLNLNVSMILHLLMVTQNS